VLGVQLDDGLWVGNLHASGRDMAELARAGNALRRWSGGGPAVLGGDFNFRRVELPGFVSAGGFDVDHVLLDGLSAAAPAEVLERGDLSDHAPVVVNVAWSSR
jgi:endonuclease/exonuclease/phosphatase (EEP) superfamily protein YafD